MIEKPRGERRISNAASEPDHYRGSSTADTPPTRGPRGRCPKRVQTRRRIRKAMVRALILHGHQRVGALLLILTKPDSQSKVPEGPSHRALRKAKRPVNFRTLRHATEW
jgi:hypothetical protein